MNKMYHCEACGKRFINNTPLCIVCGSEDVTELKKCERCGEWQEDYICKGCRNDIDMIISEAVSKIQKVTPSKSIGYMDALNMLIDRVEDLM